MADLYKSDVIDPGDRASRFAYEACRTSYENCPAVTVVPHQPRNFRGPVGFTWRRHILEQMLQNGVHHELGDEASWVMLEEVENDGAGGKPQFFTLVGTPLVFRGLGWEIITMCADDFARAGRFPAVIDNEVNAKRITEANFDLFEAMMEGYGRALAGACLVNITGEVAVMKHNITAFCDTGSDEEFVLTWGASCIGLAHRDRLLHPERIKPGMAVVGFLEPGYRCNGGTFFTNLLLERSRGDVHAIRRDPELMRFVRMLCRPSESYARLVCTVIGWNPDGSLGTPLASIHGIAHITGGGVWGKFGELLPEGVGADLHSMPAPAEVLLEGQEMSWGGSYELSDHQAYGTLHGGCGMLLVCEQEEADSVIRAASGFNVKAQRVGATIDSKDREIVIQSQFREGGVLSSKDAV